MLLCRATPALPGEPIPYRLGDDARPAMKKGRQVGWDVGLKTNPLTVLKTEGQESEAFRAMGPLAVDAEFHARGVTTVQGWEKMRAELKKRMADYFGQLPPADAPLEPKVEQPEQDRTDHTFRLVSVVFDKDHRGRIGLLVPKGLTGPGPAILLNDRWGGGIDSACGGVYSRAAAAHFLREGFLVAVIDHWDDRFGDSRTLCTAGAATHMVRRAVSYLLTLRDLVDPQRIGYWGHVYGADLIPFIASHEDRLACFVASCTCQRTVRPYTSDFWSPPFWARQGDNMGIATRTDPKMFYSARTVSTQPLPFLTQEMVAFAAPRPLLAINPEDPLLFEAVRPVWKLYGKGELVEVIQHKWGTNQPVNARDHTVDFLLRAMCGVEPGKAPEEVVREIQAGLRAGPLQRRIAAARLAGWWRCGQVTADLAALVKDADPALRRAAAKALQRIGAMKEMTPHLLHTDPMVRLAAVEMMQVVGTKEAFDLLARNDQDEDRWVNEAKWQTLQVNPWE